MSYRNPNGEYPQDPLYHPQEKNQQQDGSYGRRAGLSGNNFQQRPYFNNVSAPKTPEL